MNSSRKIGCGFLLFSIFLNLQAHDHPPKFEGIFGEPVAEISNLIVNVGYFLPYNPIVAEVGGYEGGNTRHVATMYPQGQVLVFEPNPRAFEQLLANTRDLKNVTAVNSALSTYNGLARLNINHGVYCNDFQLEKWSSLLESFCFGSDYFNCFKGPSIEVPCIILDDWCKEHHIDHIDFLHLDTEGFELQILKSSPEILKTVIVIHTKTNHTQFRKETTQYRELRAFLEGCDFVLFSHWYLEGLQGEATFIQKKIYDAIFR